MCSSTDADPPLDSLPHFRVALAEQVPATANLRNLKIADGEGSASSELRIQLACQIQAFDDRRELFVA